MKNPEFDSGFLSVNYHLQNGFYLILVISFVLKLLLVALGIVPTVFVYRFPPPRE